MGKVVTVVSIIVIVAVIFGIIYVIYSSQFHPTGTPINTPIILYDHTVYVDNIATYTLNASQGLTQQLNLTLTAYESSPPIAVPIGNINLIAYNNTIDYSNNWDTRVWNKSLVQSSVFNYSIGLKTLTLQPNMPNSTLVTINWADNAPAGRYTAEIYLGNLKFLSTQGKNDQTAPISFTSGAYASSIWLGIVVTPKNQP
jgi:hypothetical protein